MLSVFTVKHVPVSLSFFQLKLSFSQLRVELVLPRFACAGGRSGGVGPWRGSMLESFRTGVEQQQQQQQQHQLQEQKPQKNDAGRWAFYGD